MTARTRPVSTTPILCAAERRPIGPRASQGRVDSRCRRQAAGGISRVDFNASQNIQDNVEEAASGVKGENSVKLFGTDLTQMEATANKIKDVLKTVRRYRPCRSDVPWAADGDD